jgi:hypothetical protein
MTDRELIPTWRFPFPVRDTLAAISEKTGIPFATVQSQLSGRVKPSLTLVMRLSRVYGVALDELVTEAVPTSRAAIRPTDRGLTGNGRPVTLLPQWNPAHVDPGKYPGMTPDAHTDARWTTSYPWDSPDAPDYAGSGVPIPGTPDHDWWTYRMTRALGDFQRASTARTAAELSVIGHDDDDKLDATTYAKLYRKRSAAILAALEVGTEPEPLAPSAARALFAKMKRKLSQR